MINTSLSYHLLHTHVSSLYLPVTFALDVQSATEGTKGTHTHIKMLNEFCIYHNSR